MIRKMKYSFRTRIITMFLAAIIGCMAMMIISCNLFLRPLFINNSKNSMKKYGEQVSTAIGQGASPEEIKTMLSEINNAYVIKTAILSEEKVLLYNENGDGTKVLSASMERTIEWLRKQEMEKEYDKPFFRVRYDENDQIRRLFYVMKTENGKYVIMNKAIKGIEQDMQLVAIFITIMGITVAVIGSVVCSFMTKPFTSQMVKISRITRNMSRLNFDEKINCQRSDEIGILADSIDEMSQQLKESIAGLRHDLESRKHLVRNISHELKTPITTIRGYAENAQIVAAENDKIQKYCSIMIEECDDIDSLIGEMLEMSRLENSQAYERDWFDTKELFQRIAQKNKVQYPSASIQYQTENRFVFSNEQLLERAIQNYIQNAVKYGDAGKTITVEGSFSADTYRVSVTNEGSTIPEEELENLWDVFYKGDKSRKRNRSHGIGLSLVQQIAVCLDGGVDVQSGNGNTRFHIWIPAKEL